jgi:hypothetical protein
MLASWVHERDELLRQGAREECYGKRLTREGWHAFDDAMPEALEHHNDDWLFDAMASPAYWVNLFARRKPKGGFTEVRLNKPEECRRLSVGEFNTAYVRGLARALLARGESNCVVYRAGAAENTRAECTAWEGREFPLEAVLGGHRARYYPPPGERSKWSVPSGVNCHHSIRAVAAF